MNSQGYNCGPRTVFKNYFEDISLLFPIFLLNVGGGDLNRISLLARTEQKAIATDWDLLKILVFDKNVLYLQWFVLNDRFLVNILSNKKKKNYTIKIKFPQPSLLIFTKGTNKSGGHCTICH